MEVVHYSPYFLAPDTGSGNSMRSWSEALAGQGVDVRVLVEEKQSSRPPPQGISCRSIPHRLRGRLSVPVGVRDQLGSADLFVVHGGWTLWNIVACRAAAAAGIPYLVTTHGVYNPWVLENGALQKRIWNLGLERRHLRGALGLHLFFAEEREGVRSLGVGVATVVAPNGIAAPDGVRWDGGSGGYLLWLGRFDPEVKALDLLIRSLGDLRAEDRPLLRLHGPDFRGGKASMAELARGLGLERWVVIGDPIYGEEKWDAIMRAAAYVHPSRRDTSPMAVGEAVGAGVPTLVADYPLGRLLASEGAAVMCERSPRGIAAGITRVLSEEGARVARTGTAVANERLSWDAVAHSWLEQVQRLLKDRSEGSGRR